MKKAIPVWAVCFYFWIVGKLPKKIIYFAFMHVMSCATTGKHGQTKVAGLSGMDAIKRYGDDNGI